jgi:hypothetical protein
VPDAGALGGGADGVVEEFGGGPGGRGAGGAGGSVDADDGVEVDLAALLVLGDLGVGQGRVVAQGALGQSGGVGDFAAQVGGEAGPQGGGVGAPQHRAGVVVPLRVQRRTEERGAVAVPGTAGAWGGPGLVVCTGAVRVAKTRGWVESLVRTLLPPRSPAAMSW